MASFYFLAFVVIAHIFLLDRQVLRFDYETYTRYFKLMLVGAAFSFVIRLIFGSAPLASNHSIGSLLMVWWEDVMFSLLPIYYGRRFLHPKISTIITVVASLAFALGHVYISTGWAIITCFYPFYISYYIGKRHGYGTAMATHVTYDLLIFGVHTLLFTLK